MIIGKTCALSAMAFALLAAHAQAQPVSLDDKVRAFLNSKGEVHDAAVTFFPCIQPFWPRVCKEQFTFSEITVNQLGEIKFGDASPKDLPTQAYDENVTGYYCEEKGDMTVQASRQVQTSSSITDTTQYTLTIGSQLGLSGTIPNLASVSGQLTIQHATANSTATQNETTIQHQSQAQLSQKDISPPTRVIAHLHYFSTEYSAPFTGNFYVDAKIWASAHTGVDEANQPKWSSLSQVFPNQKDRAFVIDGQWIVTTKFQVAVRWDVRDYMDKYKDDTDKDNAKVKAKADCLRDSVNEPAGRQFTLGAN
jgi:hypothetical protein